MASNAAQRLGRDVSWTYDVDHISGENDSVGAFWRILVAGLCRSREAWHSPGCGTGVSARGAHVSNDNWRNQAITRFDRWSMSDMGILRQLSSLDQCVLSFASRKP